MSLTPTGIKQLMKMNEFILMERSDVEKRFLIKLHYYKITHKKKENKKTNPSTYFSPLLTFTEKSQWARDSTSLIEHAFYHERW